MATSELSAISRLGTGRVPSVVVARPPRRLLTRVALPSLIALGALGLVGYAARESLRPALVVTVEAVVQRAGGPAGGAGPGAASGEVVQAPGWIEAEPSAFGVAALEEGVVKELRALDGDRVEAGQVVALLIDDDALLVKRLAEAEVSRGEAAVTEVEAALKTEQARAAEASDAFSRVEGVSGKGLVSEEEIAARRLRLASAAAAVGTARAAVERARAEVRAAHVAVDRAALTLERMTVRSPRAGVVLQRMVEPGQRLMRDANNMYAGVVLRLYDPAHLQVRVDVPLADAAKVKEGDEVEVTTETLPGRVFKARLTRFVHEANIQKNTVQVKAVIDSPAPELKPDMLAKARITTRSKEPDGAGPGGASSSEGVLVAPRAAVVDVQGEQGAVWVLERERSAVSRRSVRLGRLTAESAEVLDGLRHGDRVVVNPPPGLYDGVKVRAAGQGDLQ